MSILGIMGVMFGAILLMGIIAVVSGNAASAALSDRLKAIPDFSAEISYTPPAFKNAIALDLEREKIAVLIDPLRLRQLEWKPVVYSFSDLIAVEVIKDGSSVIKTQRGSQLAGAAIGGVLLGPAGLLVGGLSGGKTQQNKIEKLALKLYTNDLTMPVQEILFWNSPGVGVDPNQPGIQDAAKQLDQWYGRLRAIIEKQQRSKS